MKMIASSNSLPHYCNYRCYITPWIEHSLQIKGRIWACCRNAHFSVLTTYLKRLNLRQDAAKKKTLVLIFQAGDYGFQGMACNLSHNSLFLPPFFFSSVFLNTPTQTQSHTCGRVCAHLHMYTRRNLSFLALFHLFAVLHLIEFHTDEA